MALTRDRSVNRSMSSSGEEAPRLFAFALKPRPEETAMAENEILQENLDELRDIVYDKLTARFSDDGLSFGPIVLEHEIDYVGDELLWIRIVFAGDQAKLDASWTNRMFLFLHPAMERLGLPGYPMTSFIEKSEWEDPWNWIPDYLKEEYDKEDDDDEEGDEKE